MEVFLGSLELEGEELDLETGFFSNSCMTLFSASDAVVSAMYPSELASFPRTKDLKTTESEPILFAKASFSLSG
jgi:hypothetical protein